MAIIKEFFGFGGYTRPAEGYMSWQHLTFVSSLVAIMLALAIVLGIIYKKKSPKDKNKILIISAILIDAFEIFLIIMLMWRGKDLTVWERKLPLFLCSIQLITIPLAAFTRGRLKEASLDFVAIFGLIGAVLGTYFAGQNYGCYPVLSVDNVISGITHCISGFAALYIMVSGMMSMKWKNIWITFAIIFGFSGGALIANKALDYNYMFLRAGDGTPYTILENFLKSFLNEGAFKIVYPACLIGMFLLLICAFYGVYNLIKALSSRKTKA